jgi:hypothetical protein
VCARVRAREVARVCVRAVTRARVRVADARARGDASVRAQRICLAQDLELSDREDLVHVELCELVADSRGLEVCACATMRPRRKSPASYCCEHLSIIRHRGKFREYTRGYYT